MEAVCIMIYSKDKLEGGYEIAATCSIICLISACFVNFTFRMPFLTCPGVPLRLAQRELGHALTNPHDLSRNKPVLIMRG